MVLIQSYLKSQIWETLLTGVGKKLRIANSLHDKYNNYIWGHKLFMQYFLTTFLMCRLMTKNIFYDDFDLCSLY